VAHAPAFRLDRAERRVERKVRPGFGQERVVHALERFDVRGRPRERLLFLQPVEYASSETAGQEMHAVRHRHENRYAPCRAHAPEAGVRLGQKNPRALTPRRHRRRRARRAAARHEHVHVILDQAVANQKKRL